MTEPTERSDALIDLKVDASLYKLAAIFSSVAFPEGMPDYQKIAILEAVERERNAEGSPGIENRMSPDEKEKREARSRDNLDYLVSVMEDAQERERQEWQRTRSTLGGVTMTGQEWKSLSNDLKEGGPLREWLIARMMKDGKSRDEAERKTDEMADIYAANAKPESQRTKGEQAAIDKADTDPEFQRYNKLVSGAQSQLSQAAENRTAVAADQSQSVEARSDIFASAPMLSGEYKTALAATTPLEQKPASQPVAPAPNGPAMAGLEV